MNKLEQLREAAALCSAAASNTEQLFIFEAIGYDDADVRSLVNAAYRGTPQCATCREHGHAGYGCRLQWAEAEAKIMNGEVT